MPNEKGAFPVYIRGLSFALQSFSYLRLVELLLQILLVVCIHQLLYSLHQVCVDSMVFDLHETSNVLVRW